VPLVGYFRLSGDEMLSSFKEKLRSHYSEIRHDEPTGISRNENLGVIFDGSNDP